MNSQANTEDPSTKETIRRVCNAVLMEIAPEEMILTDHVLDTVLANSPDSLDEKNFADDYVDTPLGFGSDGELYVAIIVPVIIGVLSKMLTSFSDEKLKQAVNLIKGGKEKNGLEIEIEVDKIKREYTIHLSGKKLTHKKAEIITNRILRVIAEELSR